VHGLRPEGFDYGNSPSALVGLDLGGRRLIQRTSAGTQGIVRSRQAETLLASSFVCASATASYLKRQLPEAVTFVVTGVFPGADGDEDIACADYLAALLRGESPDVTLYLQRVRDSSEGHFFDESPPRSPLSDLECCLSVDRFDFAMVIERQDGLLVMRATRQT
jgi:2-phosphosulfolactate phosphatase